jgi:hypothetical protein
MPSPAGVVWSPRLAGPIPIRQLPTPATHRRHRQPPRPSITAPAAFPPPVPCPVVAVACQQAHAGRVAPDHHAEAVEFDLVDPIGSGW